MEWRSRVAVEMSGESVMGIVGTIWEAKGLFMAWSWGTDGRFRDG